MRIGAPLTDRSPRFGVVASVLLHAAVLVVMIAAPRLGFFKTEPPAPEVTLVRLKGGGENIPGWIKPTTAQPDDTPVPDNKPKPRPEADEPTPEPEPAPAPEEPEPEPAAAEPEPEPETVPTEPEGTEAVEEAETPGPEAEPDAETGEEAAAAEEETGGPPQEETGAGVGRKPGPEGPGFGAYSDADFPGANAFLSRVEAEVQRRFNFRGRGTGAVAEYHFYINKRGELKDLVLMESSGIASLDLAARSALMRAKFPPLPPGFGHDRLGVTYRFHDDK